MYPHPLLPLHISNCACAPPYFDLTQATHLQTSRGEREATKYHLLLLQVFCLANNTRNGRCKSFWPNFFFSANQPGKEKKGKEEKTKKRGTRVGFSNNMNESTKHTLCQRLPFFLKCLYYNLSHYLMRSYR